MIASSGSLGSLLVRGFIVGSALLLAACSSTRPPLRSAPTPGFEAPTVDLDRFQPAAGVSATLPATYLPPPPATTASAGPPRASGTANFQDGEEGSGTQLPVGFGLALSPSMALIGAALDFEIDEDLTAGPALQVGLGGDDTLIAPFFQAKYRLPIEAEEGSALNKITPFIQAGAGLAFLDKDGRKSDTGVLLNAGAGVRFNTGRSTRLGSTALFNFLPGDVAGDNFYFTWEIVQVSFDF